MRPLYPQFVYIIRLFEDSRSRLLYCNINPKKLPATHSLYKYIADSLQQVPSEVRNEHDAAEQLCTCMYIAYYQNKVQEVT